MPKKEYTEDELAVKAARKRLKEFKDNVLPKYSAGSNMSDDDCKTYIYAKAGTQLLKGHPDGYAYARWKYAMGQIGSVTYTYCSGLETSKEKAFDKHPAWRPIGEYTIFTNNWDGSSMMVKGCIQDWDDILNISDTDSFTIKLYKHPIQY